MFRQSFFFTLNPGLRWQHTHPKNKAIAHTMIVIPSKVAIFCSFHPKELQKSCNNHKISRCDSSALMPFT